MTKEEALKKIEELQKYIEELDKKEVGANWRADNGDQYWHVNFWNEVCPSLELSVATDNWRWLTGNYFKTEKEAQEYKDYLEAKGRVMRAIHEINEGWEPDWGDRNEEKWNILYDHYANGFEANWRLLNQLLLDMPCIRTLEKAKRIIKDYEKDLRVIFEYKKKNLN